MIMTNQWNRLESIYGQVVLQKLQGSTVFLCGLGGVGSNCLNVLARSAISNFVLVDFDTVDPSNINRQAVARLDTVGRPKTQVAKKDVLNINSNAKVEVFDKKLDADNTYEFLESVNAKLPFDFVLDCIDCIPAKVEIARFAQDKNIPIISSMGAAEKFDNFAIQLADLYDTYNCPLAKSFRHQAKKAGIKYLPVVFSAEEQDTEKVSSSRKTGTPLGTTSYLPTLFGIHMAAECIKHLIK